jgi:Leucine-rich repeat (LRR) protein
MALFKVQFPNVLILHAFGTYRSTTSLVLQQQSESMCSIFFVTFLCFIGVVGNLSKMWSLDLSYNNIEGFSDLSQLKELLASFNNVSTLPPLYTGMSRL